MSEDDEVPVESVADQPPARRSRAIRTGRLEALSDGIFAIAITLLVLDLAVPADASKDLLKALAEQWPSYLTYVVSFATIGAIWLGHTIITEYLELADATLIRLNLFVLLVVSFLPFPTRLLGDYIRQPGAERVAATVYGLNLLLATVALSLLWRYSVRANLVRPDMSDREVQFLTTRITPGMGGYVVLILLGLFLPVVAVFGYLVIAVFLILPFASMWLRPKPPRRPQAQPH
jgi:uncharacterized membrane protein